MNIKDIVKDGNKVFYDRFRDGLFYYNVAVPIANEDEIILEFYQFPVPLEDIGKGTMLREDKAITYMRWIRKAIEDKTMLKV